MRCSCFVFLIALVFILNAHTAIGFLFRKLPSATSYEQGTSLRIMVNSLTSKADLLPYNFYSIPTCVPDKQTMQEGKVRENIGEILLGNRIMPSVYNVEVGVNIPCKLVCSVQYEKKKMRRVQRLIKQLYRAHMFLEGLPLVEQQPEGVVVRGLRLGYRLGFSQYVNGALTTYLHNHLNFTIMYSVTGDNMYAISGFYVTPLSLQDTCSEKFQEGFVEAVGRKKVDFSYSVSWVKDTDDNALTTRWDIYARSTQSAAQKGHRLAILNSILLLCFLGLVVAHILLRTIIRDQKLYATSLLTNGDLSEKGWRLIYSDVFRAPSNALVFSGIVGTGSQAIMMFTVTIVSAFFGILQPSQRGNLLSGLIVFFCLGNGVSGYVAARMLKFFHKQNWTNGFASIMIVPVFFLACYFIPNLVNWYEHATTAIPFGTLVSVIFLWFALFLPLGFFGLWLGFRARVIEPPCKVGKIPREIPVESRTRRFFYIVGGGFVIFIAAFVEIVYILGALWKGEPFHYFGYFASIIFIIGLGCGEVAIVVTYALLTEEDYDWWWGSLCSSGSSGLFFYVYGLVYLFTTLEITHSVSIVLYVVYMSGISVLISVLTGTVGFLASAVFVYIIYSSVKLE